ncbi:YraN family protein [Paenalcaligenes niemegkensis]|uniref:YraN family protein n=1 Tax=Paenalcaligenes niemegkensis TaxID=2895469 RepID=UPI002150EB77|nr:YraN family protein [Paenalcaligenes niemegkensis]MCQ9615571.1 YraN family protein [Paenalcaligenes niemegkensis]
MHPAPQTSPSQDVGFKYEARAAIYLQDHGLHILQRNARTQVGEIDLIATERTVPDICRSTLPCQSPLRRCLG